MGSALHHVEAHRPGAAFDNLGRSVEVVRVQILHLDLSNVSKLRTANGARGCLSRLLRSFLDLRRLLEEERSWRGLGQEGEATIRIDGYYGRDRCALLELLRRGVERLAEFHDVDAALPECRPDRRRWIGSAGRHLELDISGNFLCHYVTLLEEGTEERYAPAQFKFSGPSGHPKMPSRGF